MDELDQAEPSSRPSVELPVPSEPICETSSLKKAVEYLEEPSRPLTKPEVWIERWSDLWPDCRKMMLLHRRELKQDHFPLDLDHARIEALEQQGGLLCLAARKSSGELVGYAIWYLMPSLESKGILLAEQGPWYVTAEHRKDGVGLELRRRSWEILRRRGVKQVMSHHSALTPDLEKLFLREGSELIGQLYYRYL